VIFAFLAAIPTARAEASQSSWKSKSASEAASWHKYHKCFVAVSPGASSAVSHSIDADTTAPLQPDGTGYFLLDHTLHLPINSILESGASQYHPSSDEGKRRLMIFVGLGLGAAYVFFLSAWIWATRLRSRPRRH
jgi:hypothetical protein